MKLINLTEHTRNPKNYSKDRDILTSLAWSALKRTLEEQGKSFIYDSIQSIHIGDKYITIATRKPIVNTEIKLLQKVILGAINTAFEPYSSLSRIGIRTL